MPCRSFRCLELCWSNVFCVCHHAPCLHANRAMSVTVTPQHPLVARGACHHRDMPSSASTAPVGSFDAWCAYRCWCRGALHANACLKVKAIPSSSKQSLCLFKGAEHKCVSPLVINLSFVVIHWYFIGKFKLLWTLAFETGSFPHPSRMAAHLTAAVSHFESIASSHQHSLTKVSSSDLENVKHTEALLQIAAAALLIVDKIIKR